MELWFLLAIGSAIFGGFESFVHKVAAEKGHDVAILSTFASTLTVVIAFVCTLLFSDLSGFWTMATLFIMLSALINIPSLLAKVAALRCIDTAIFFPIYKVTGPLIVIAIGIMFFQESFSSIEWIGLMLSLLVPLMLITKSENDRQRNLSRGLLFLCGAAALAALSMAFTKQSVDVAVNIWMVTLGFEVFRMLASAMLVGMQHKANAIKNMSKELSSETLRLVFFMGIFQVSVAICVHQAYFAGGSLGIVYTINSLYILIPIVLSIFFYKEHWNARKVTAIALSILAIGLLK